MGHVSFEIHQFTNEILADSKNFQKCHEYFHEKRREVKRDDLIWGVWFVKNPARILAGMTCGTINYAGSVTLFVISLLWTGIFLRSIGKKVQIIHAL